MNPCIVSVSSLGREDYREAQLNLIKSCVTAGWKGDYLFRCVGGYCDEYMGVKIELGSWPVTKRYGVSWQHADQAYQFKPYALWEAYEAGYRKLIWVDSTCRMLKDPEPLFRIAKEQGIVTWNNIGWPVVNWITDTALKNLHETTTSLKEVKQIMACCQIWDMDVPGMVDLLEQWLIESRNSTFRDDETNRPDFKGNRHDQACLSVLLHQRKIPVLDYGDGFCYYPHNETGEHIKDGRIYLINKGVKD